VGYKSWGRTRVACAHRNWDIGLTTYEKRARDTKVRGNKRRNLQNERGEVLGPVGQLLGIGAADQQRSNGRLEWSFGEVEECEEEKKTTYRPLRNKNVSRN